MTSFPSSEGRSVARATANNDTTWLRTNLPNIKVGGLGVNQSGNSVLVVAVDADAVGAADLLLEAGANPNFVTGTGEAPLKAAVRPKGSSAEWGERVAMTRLLLDYGADPNLGSYDRADEPDERWSWETPLSISSRWSRTLTEILLRGGADPNRYANGLTPLGGVLIRADFEMLRTLSCVGASSFEVPLAVRASGEELRVEWYIARLQSQLSDNQKGAAGSPQDVAQISTFIDEYRRDPVAACP